MASKLIFTSGTQAVQGRMVNHDPEPYYVAESERRYSTSAVYESAGSDNDILYQLAVLKPRPKYAVTDNPILAAFRDYLSVWRVPTPQLAKEWLWLSPRQMPTSVSIDLSKVSYAYTEHARRVFDRLAKLAG